MKPETDPITDDEWLLRRVRVERFRTDKTLIISPNAFEPRVKGRDIDDTGISLYREACISSPTDILATVAEDKRHEFGIVRVPVSQLTALNLTIIINPDYRVLGHVVIRELNAMDIVKGKSKFIPILLEIAEVASEENNILRWPTPVPGAE